MASEMPETVRLIDEDGILKFPAEQVGTEYVLATTHQRTVEALREAEKAIRNAYGAITSGQTEDKDAAGTLRAALARIKEATDAQAPT